MPILTVTAIVGFSKSKIYALIQRDEFPQPVKIGKVARWRAAEVQQWLREQGGSDGGLAMPLRVLDPASGHVEGLTRAVVRLAGQVKALVARSEAQGEQIDALLKMLNRNGHAPIVKSGSEAFEVAEPHTETSHVTTALAVMSQAERLDEVRRDTPAEPAQVAMPEWMARKKVMEYFSVHMCIPSPTMVPFASQVDALARILCRLPEPAPGQWQAMERWFWRTSVSGFGGWAGGMRASAVAAIEAFESGQESELDAPMTSPGPSLWFNRPFRFNSALAKTLVLILVKAHPKDLLTGKDIDTPKALVWWGAREFHQLFPYSFLLGKGVSSSKAMALANTICLSPESNEVLKGQRPSQFLARLLDERGDAVRSWLATNLVGDEAIDAALIDDYDGFLVARAATIDEHVRRLAGWD